MEPQSTNYAAYVNVTVVNPRCANSFGRMFNIEKINLDFVPPSVLFLPVGGSQGGEVGCSGEELLRFSSSQSSYSSSAAVRVTIHNLTQSLYHPPSCVRMLQREERQRGEKERREWDKAVWEARGAKGGVGGESGRTGGSVGEPWGRICWEAVCRKREGV